MSAAAHLVVAGPTWAWYRRNLLEKRSYARWIEYSFSSSLMIVLIAMITGIADVAALVALFGVNASMILFGLLQEHYERPGRQLPTVHQQQQARIDEHHQAADAGRDHQQHQRLVEADQQDREAERDEAPHQPEVEPALGERPSAGRTVFSTSAASRLV